MGGSIFVWCLYGDNDGDNSNFGDDGHSGGDDDGGDGHSGGDGDLGKMIMIVGMMAVINNKCFHEDNNGNDYADTNVTLTVISWIITMMVVIVKVIKMQMLIMRLRMVDNDDSDANEWLQK